MDIAVVHNLAKNRFEAIVGERTAGVLKYDFKSGFVMSISLLKVKSDFDVKEVEDNLVEIASKYIITNGYRIQVDCPRFREYIKDRDDLLELLVTADNDE
ncbi:hypothetical protein M2132_001854 [Dysgonomonas sp. PH5-45]|uniref:hypothetical protein n=1 Tax=unclassified Dysgonomonas TaxID=2630389 RepID=UPI0024736124|nr:MULTISPECIES: hypothetical protein [unclassified Dysgonomonas]MDH6355509.1 hypothetical protein [Dysgonomonas sp. PH5-45]MDH6388430.1 hypothetical protein [Dysgonomonas sp. PH5-37]